MTQTLWNATRGRKVYDGVVSTWNAYVPGTNFILPMLQVTAPADHPYYECLEEIESHTTGVWAWTEEGRDIAERIVRDIAQTRFAVVWPHEEKHIFIAFGEFHSVKILSNKGDYDAHQ